MATIDLGESYAFPAEASRYGPGVGNIGSAPINNRTYSSSPSPSQSYSSGGSGGSGGLSSVYKNPTEGKIASTTQRGTTTPVAPSTPMPTMAGVPAVDEARIRRLTQTRSAAGQRSLRAALREQILQSSYQENPNVAAMINRKSMEGFGQGIADVYTKAQQQATAEEFRDRQMQWSRSQAVFNAAMQDYMKRFGSKTESTTGYTYDQGENAYRMTVSPSGQVTNTPVTQDVSAARDALRQMMAGTYKG